MTKSRLNNSIRNSLTAVGSQLLVTALNFINRSVFIYVLGSEYLGINGLFSNILSMLSLTMRWGSGLLLYLICIKLLKK